MFARMTLAFALFIALTHAASAAPLKVECLGPQTNAAAQFIYLHGFEPLANKSPEEAGNIEVIERLAKRLKLRFALPKGPRCPGNKYCWPAKTDEDVKATFAAIRTAARTCWSSDKPYMLLGFSNGGYFAFKTYRTHEDPKLEHIIASGSSGIWRPEEDKPNRFSTFDLMIGDKDITRKDASAFAALFEKSVPGFRLKIFEGGHRLDEATLETVLRNYLKPKT